MRPLAGQESTGCHGRELQRTVGNQAKDCIGTGANALGCSLLSVAMKSQKETACNLWGLIPSGGQKVSFAGSVEEVSEEPSFPTELEKPEGVECEEAKAQLNREEAEVELTQADPPLAGNRIVSSSGGCREVA